MAHLFSAGAVLSAQNGLGSEEVMAALMPSGHVIRGTTFMSATRFADDHVHYELQHRDLDGTVRADKYSL